MLLLVIILLPFVLDANQYRPRIESMLNAGLNRKVSIGNIRLSIFSGGVAIDNIRNCGRSRVRPGDVSGSEVAEGGRRADAVDFFACAQRNGNLDRCAAGDAAAVASGVWNFSTLGPAAAKPGGAAPAQTPGQAANTNVSVQKLTLKDGTVFVGDVAGAGKSGTNTSRWMWTLRIFPTLRNFHLS